MPRPRLLRRIRFQPGITYFKPAGTRIVELAESILTMDELESLRLKDLMGLGQEEAAKKMKISQPTFNRLISSARRKVADALVNGKAIKIEGGTYKMVQPRSRMEQGKGRGMGFGGPAMSCVCPSCGHQTPKQRGVPCASTKCPKCGNPMMRGQ